MATRQEFTKLLNSLNKQELVKIILNFTKRNKTVQDSIFSEYSKEEDLSYVDFDFIEKQLDAIDKKIFTKNWMTIGSTVVSKYCREVNKMINSYIEPLVKQKKYYQAFNLLQEVFYSLASNRIGMSLYKYSQSSSTFFNKIDKNFKTIIEKSQGLERFRIAKSLFDNLHRDYGDPFLIYNMQYVAEEYFTDWEDEEEEILINEVHEFLKEYDENTPAPDDLSECVGYLLNLKLKNNDSQAEIDELTEKYKYLGDVIRFKAQRYLDEKNFTKAKEYLKESNELPTMTILQQQKNSDLLIQILWKENTDLAELKKELKYNLDTYLQTEYDNLFLYYALLDKSKLDEAEVHYLTYPTTKPLYSKGDIATSYFLVLRDLKNKNYKKLEGVNLAYIELLHKYCPDQINEFIETIVKQYMADGPTDYNYKQSEQYLDLFHRFPDTQEAYEKLKQELLEKYKARTKLKNIFDRIESEKSNQNFFY